MPAPAISRPAWQAAIGLVCTHFAIWAWISWRGITYDWGGFEQLLWWVVAFLVLPALALVILAASFFAGLRRSRIRDGE